MVRGLTGQQREEAMMQEECYVEGAVQTIEDRLIRLAGSGQLAVEVLEAWGAVRDAMRHAGSHPGDALIGLEDRRVLKAKREQGSRAMREF